MAIRKVKNDCSVVYTNSSDDYSGVDISKVMIERGFHVEHDGFTQSAIKVLVCCSEQPTTNKAYKEFRDTVYKTATYFDNEKRHLLYQIEEFDPPSKTALFLEIICKHLELSDQERDLLYSDCKQARPSAKREENLNSGALLREYSELKAENLELKKQLECALQNKPYYKTADKEFVRKARLEFFDKQLKNESETNQASSAKNRL